MLFKHAEIFTPQGFVRGAFTVEDGRFGEILPQSPDMPGTDLGGARVIPGLIDIHNHGNSGADFSDGDPDGIRTMARYLAKNGVTSFAPASMTLPYDVLARAFRAAADYNRAAHPGCARLMGIQMEGPFFSEKKKGAQNGAYLRLPDFEAFRALYEASEDCCASWTWRRSCRAQWTLPRRPRSSARSPSRIPTAAMRMPRRSSPPGPAI